MHFEIYILIYIESIWGRAVKKIQRKGSKTMPLCCYIGKMHHAADLHLWLKVMMSRKRISRACFVSTLLKPRFLQMSELSHGSIKKKSQKLD